MRILLSICCFYLCMLSSNVMCESRDDLVDKLLQETMELKKEMVSVKAQNKQMWNKIQQLEEVNVVQGNKAKRLLMSLPQHKKPAFSASLTNHMTNLGNYQSIIFDHVLASDGNAYSPVTGVFAAPNNGTYFFTSTVMSHSGQYLETQICLNGNGLVFMYSLDKSFEQGTNSVVLTLKEGDRVWVRHNGNEGSNVYGGHWSTFSGFQISV